MVNGNIDRLEDTRWEGLEDLQRISGRGHERWSWG